MSGKSAWTLDPDRCFSPVPSVRERARELYEAVRDLPLVCPHGHVNPELLADPDARFGNPAELLIIPDHYVFRMLHSQGVRLEELGLAPAGGGAYETDPRAIWQRFAENFHLFRGTPTGLWLKDELVSLFGVDEKLTAANAQTIYDHLDAQLQLEEFTPRALFRRFDIEVLCTTDAATDTLEPHAQLQAQGFPVRPTFRPDRLFDITAPHWRRSLELLGERAGMPIGDLGSFIRALERRREAFRERGALATDHASLRPHTERLTQREAEQIFREALRGVASEGDERRFTAHMLMEMARMSAEDGLVMQLHAGSLRNHNAALYESFGPDKGADMPVAVDWTRGLGDLLNEFGSNANFTLIAFTLDESTYARELAPLAGHYPALRLGAPWWFFDSVKGMERYLDRVVETAGLYNLAGFNDDTRAFPSIPSRHDVWRRVSSNWLAEQIERGLLDEDEGHEAAHWLSYGSARDAYRMSGPEGQPQQA